MSRRATGLILLALSAGLLGGCGDDPAELLPGRTVDVTLDEYSLSPDAIRARPGLLHLRARNAGRLTHNLVVRTISDDPEEPPETLIRLQTLHAGERTEGTVRLREGSYELLCTIANHRILGERGELVVK